MDYRRKALMDYGLWHRYVGLRRRWDFYDGLIDDKLNLSRYQPALDVNGLSINLGNHPIEPLKQRWGPLS